MTTEERTAAAGEAVVEIDPQVEIEPHTLLGLAAGEHNLELLMDVPVTVSVEIGRTRLSIKEVLDLSPGSIVSLGKLTGEPMDLLVNGKRIAQGEIVIVDESFGMRDSFGIRVTSIVAKL